MSEQLTEVLEVLKSILKAIEDRTVYIKKE